MLRKEFIDYLADKSGIKQRDLIEKDFILQSLIKELAADKFFSSSFVFKGGTCLIKCYLGYYRFSEDLDFTWKNQDLWKNKSGKQVRKAIAAEITALSAALARTCSGSGMDFKPDKKDKRYIEFGGSNIFATFKLWYTSAVSNREEFVKLQINFVEVFKYQPAQRAAESLMIGIDLKELKFLFPEYAEVMSSKTQIAAYDIKEILIEKVRALITRRGIKARDFIDVFFILKLLNGDIKDHEKAIIEKVLFMLKYEKYLKNLLEKHRLFEAFELGSEDNILLQPMAKGFDKFVQEFYPFLNQLLEKIKRRLVSS